MIDVNTIINDYVIGPTLEYAPKLIGAILVLFIGLRIIRYLAGLIEKTLTKRKVDASLSHFLTSIVSIGARVMLFISAASMVGIETTSFVAIIGAAGLAVGLALQGSLANFAGGVLILLFKPFEIGDYIEGAGESGVVTSIEIFSTVLTTPDNKIVILPNGMLSNSVIKNYTKEKTRRVDLVFGIDYGDDLKKAQRLLLELAKKHKKVLKTPEPFARVAELGDNSVNFKVRAWTKTDDYWDVYFDLMEQVKLTFDKEGISFPFPQRDIHLYQEK